MAHIWLITAAAQKAVDEGWLDRLFDSIPGAGCTADLTLVLIAQGIRDEDRSRLCHPARPFAVECIALPDLAPLAVSRNMALAAIAERLADDDWVLFPDDDAWFYPGFFDRLAAEWDPGADFMCGSYGPVAGRIEEPRFSPSDGHLTEALAFAHVSSVTLFLTGRVVRRVGLFDPRFGAGTPVRAGEDVDYVLRILSAGFAGVYRPRLMIGHIIKEGNRMAYWGGNFILLAKHARRSRAIALDTLKRAAEGLRLVRGGDLAAGGLMTSCWWALKVFLAPRWTMPLPETKDLAR